MLLDKLEAIKQRFEDVEMQLSSPGVMGDMKRFAQLNRESSIKTQFEIRFEEELEKIKSSLIKKRRSQNNRQSQAKNRTSQTKISLHSRKVSNRLEQ